MATWITTTTVSPPNQEVTLYMNNDTDGGLGRPQTVYYRGPQMSIAQMHVYSPTVDSSENLRYNGIEKYNDIITL
jgi:hypothetical protein